MKDQKTMAHYFKKYSHSLQRLTNLKFQKYFHDGKYNPLECIYLCPLCLYNTIGIIDEYAYYKEEFTLDHFPPKNAGGTNTVLVCKKCNNVAGAKFENSLKDWLNLQGFNEGCTNAKLSSTLYFEDVPGRYNCTLRMEKDKQMKLEDVEKYPYAVDAFKKMLQGSSIKARIGITPPKDENVFKALLKSAYLYCFSIWGYDFAYSQTAAHIRNVIYNNKRHVLSNWGIFFRMQDDPAPDGLNYIYEPLERQIFMINMKLKSKECNYNCGVSIMIPGADSYCWGQQRSYQEIIDNNENYSGSIIKLPEDSLNKIPFPYIDTWSHRFNFRIKGYNC